MVKLRDMASRNKLRELREHPNVESRAILSQAAKAEGATTIPMGVGPSGPKRGAVASLEPMIWSGLHGDMQQGLTGKGVMWYYSVKQLEREVGMKVTLELVERFHEKWEVDKKSRCWCWTASAAGKGYGQIKIPGTRRQIYAHRLSYMIHYGEIPEGMYVCHVCDNPLCVKPTHLFLGTCEDNLQDMKRKDRHLCGAKNKRAKLTEEQVRHMHILNIQGVSQGKIASVYPVAQQTVCKILRGESWEHVYREIYPE